MFLLLIYLYIYFFLSELAKQAYDLHDDGKRLLSSINSCDTDRVLPTLNPLSSRGFGNCNHPTQGHLAPIFCVLLRRLLHLMYIVAHVPDDVTA